MPKIDKNKKVDFNKLPEQFWALVTKVVDGDTIKILYEDAEIRVRLENINTLELNDGGDRAKAWLKQEIEGEECLINLAPKRLDKYGRLVASVNNRGLDMSNTLIHQGFAKSFQDFGSGQLFNIQKEFDLNARLN